MNFSAVESRRVTNRAYRGSIRWNAVFAGTCVGIATYLLATLLGICISMTASEAMSGPGVSMAALGWNMGSALVAAMLGTFIAARCADLRHPVEGAIHGLVVWGCATLLLLFIVLGLVREVTGGVAMVLAQGAERHTNLAQNDGERGWNRNVRQTALGDAGVPVTSQRRSDFVNARAVRASDEDAGSPVKNNREMGMPAYAILMMAAALAISLFGGIAGGLLGTRSHQPEKHVDALDWGDMDQIP